MGYLRDIWLCCCRFCCCCCCNSPKAPENGPLKYCINVTDESLSVGWLASFRSSVSKEMFYFYLFIDSNPLEHFFSVSCFNVYLAEFHRHSILCFSVK